MQEKKSVRRWFEELPEDVKQKAINNTTEHEGNHEGFLDSYEVESMYWAIHSSFVWSDSPEGFKFWNELSQKYLNNK